MSERFSGGKGDAGIPPTLNLTDKLAARSETTTRPARIDPSFSRKGPDIPRPTVLLIEDEDLVLGVIQTILERNGYRVLTGTNGREGVQAFNDRAGSIDLVIMDMNMPLMNGPEAATRMRRIKPEIPILLSGGSGELELETSCRELGLSGYLCKPFRAQDLLDEVRQILDRSPQRQS